MSGEPLETDIEGLGRIDRGSLVLVSPSLKPSPGSTARSASRSLLVAVGTRLRTIYPDVHLMDLRGLDLPHFRGEVPADLGPPAADVVAAIARAGALLLAVPGYWSGISASFKNFIELVCGPAYDLAPPWTTAFTGKSVGLLVVGADEDSTIQAGQQARLILEATGARLLGAPVLLVDPRRNESEIPRALAETLGLAAALVHAIAETSP